MDGRRRKTVHAARRPEERPKDASHSSTFTECTAAMLTLPSFAGPTSARSVTRTVRMRFSVGTGLQRLCTTRTATPRTRTPAVAIGGSCAFSRRFATRWKTPAPHQRRRFRGYLFECMTWNVPNAAFAESTWDTRVQAVLAHLWINTQDDANCTSWCEVDDIKYLFRASQPWTRAAAHTFINEARDFVGVRSS